MIYIEIFIITIDIVFTPINIYNFIQGKKYNSKSMIVASIISQILLTFSFINCIWEGVINV